MDDCMEDQIINDPHNLIFDDLVDALRLTAGEASGPEWAGMNLLALHRVWLRAPLFVVECVEAWHDPETDEIGARILWERVDALLDSLNDPEAETDSEWPCSASELAVLRIAASIADGHEVALQRVLRGLDAHTVALVASAVVAATRKQNDVLITRTPSAASTPGKQVANWIDDLIECRAYTFADLKAAAATDEGLRALLVTAATGETGALNRARLRATKGTPAHASAPPAVLSAIAGLPVTDREWQELLPEFRSWWIF